MPSYKLEILVDGQDRASGPLGGVMGALGGLGKATVALAGSGLVALAGGLGASIKVSSEFGKQMSAVQAVSLATAGEMDALSAAALRIGKDTSFGATEAGSAIEMLVANGIKINDVLNGAADSTVALAAATGADLTTAANVASDAMNIFGISAADMSQAVNGISGVTVASKFGINDYALALAQGGGVAKASGVNFKDFNTTITAISPLFASGSDAGTSFKTMLTTLIPKSKDAEQAMRDLNLITADGRNQFYNADGSMKSMAEVAGLLQGALSGLSDEQRNNTLSTIFGADASRAAAALAETGAEKFRALAGSIGEVDAAAQAATRLDNLAGDVDALTGSLETAGIQIGTAFTPILRDLTQAASAFVNAHLIDQDWSPLVNGITGAVDSARPFVLVLMDLGRYAAAVVQDGDYLNDWLTHLPVGMQGVVETSGQVAGTLMGLGDTISGGLRTGLDWLSVTGLPAAQGGLSQLTGLLSPLRDGLQPVIDGFQEGGLKGALAAVPGVILPTLGSVNDLRNQLIALALDGVAGLTDQLADNAGFKAFLEQMGLSEDQIGDVQAILGDLSGGLRTAGGWVVDVGRWLQDDLLPPVISAGQGFATMLLPHLRWLADFGNQRVMPFLRDIGGFIGDNLPGAINVVSPLLSGLVDIGLSAVELALMGIATTWEVWLKPAFEAIGTWLGDLTGGWDNLARGAEVLKGTMTDIAQAIRDVAAGRVDFSQIFGGLGELAHMLGLGGQQAGQQAAPPQFATGVRNFRGGLAIAGEHGPELLNLAAGTDVYTAGETGRMLGSGGGAGAGGSGGLTFAPTIIVQGSVLAERDLFQRMREAAAEFQRYNGTSNIG